MTLTRLGRQRRARSCPARPHTARHRRTRRLPQTPRRPPRSPGHYVDCPRRGDGRDRRAQCRRRRLCGQAVSPRRTGGLHPRSATHRPAPRGESGPRRADWPKPMVAASNSRPSTQPRSHCHCSPSGADEAHAQDALRRIRPSNVGRKSRNPGVPAGGMAIFGQPRSVFGVKCASRRRHRAQVTGARGRLRGLRPHRCRLGHPPRRRPSHPRQWCHRGSRAQPGRQSRVG